MIRWGNWGMGGALLLFALAVLPHGEALYTKVKMGNSKCFIELMHANEPMVVVYDIPDQAPLPLESEQQKNHVGIRFQAVNHKGKVFDARLNNKGRLSFVSHDSGEHRLCFSIEGTSYIDFRVHLEFHMKLDGEDHEAMIKSEQLSAMDLRVRQLGDLLQEIRSEQDYFKAREQRFFETTESTNIRAQWCSVWQIVGMVAVTATNVFYLQHYFTSKKVV